MPPDSTPAESPGPGADDPGQPYRVEPPPFEDPARIATEPALPAAPPRPPFPGFWGGLLLIVLVQILANVVAGFVIVAFMLARHVPLAEWGTGMPDLATIGIIANSLGFAPVIYIAWKQSRMAASSVFPLRPVAVGWWLPLLVTLAGGIFVAEDVTNVLYRILPPPDWFRDIFAQVVGKGTGFSSLFFLVIVAPVTEEFLFRGVILNGFLRRYGTARAVFASAFLFGLIHLDPWQLVPAFILGALFALWRVHTGSIWPGLVAHAVTNGIAFQQGLSQDPRDLFKPESQPLWLTALGVALLLAGLQWSFQVFRQRNAMAVRGD